MLESGGGGHRLGWKLMFLPIQEWIANVRGPRPTNQLSKRRKHPHFQMERVCNGRVRNGRSFLLLARVSEDADFWSATNHLSLLAQQSAWEANNAAHFFISSSYQHIWRPRWPRFGSMVLLHVNNGRTLIALFNTCFEDKPCTNMCVCFYLYIQAKPFDNLIRQRTLVTGTVTEWCIFCFFFKVNPFLARNSLMNAFLRTTFSFVWKEPTRLS